MDPARPEEGPPKPPTPPVEGECCGRGCERCVWVYYHEARERYEAALAAWQASAETRA
jgi:hypothetical protein